MNNRADDNVKAVKNKSDILFYNVPHTKFSVPYYGTPPIDRKSIEYRLNEAAGKKLTIVTAPAGYGKSTAVSSWVLKNMGSKAFIWINLDEEDREESVFWHNIIYSVNGHEDIISYDRVPALSVEQCINLLINYFSKLSSDCFIIFDDFHNADCGKIHKSFEYLLSYIPRNLHGIIIGRTFPGLSMSRLMIDDDVEVLDAKDLRFSYEEMNAFLNGAMGLSLTEEDVRLLELKTEGWIAALKAAAVSLKNCSDKSVFINSFDSSNKKMLRYVFEEVVNFQEAAVKEFLLKTSILKNLNSSICDALTGWDNSQDILSFLDGNGLFIVRMYERQENYRYHHLLSDILGKLLLKEYPDRVDELYLAASRWHEEHGYYRDALEYSAASAVPGNTLRLLEKYYGSEHTDIFSPKSICNYFETIPCEMYNKMPELCIRYALALAETGQISRDENELIKRGIYLDGELFESYEGQVNQLRAYTALKYEDMAGVIRYSEQALQKLPQSDVSSVTLCLILGYIYRALGDLKKAEYCFNNALTASNKVNAVQPGKAWESLILSNFYMTSIRYLKGESEDFITPLNQLLTENITHKNCMYFCLAAVHYDDGGLEQAYAYVMKGLELCNTYEDVFYERVKGLVLLARILFHTGKGSEAVSVMDEIDSLVKPDSGNMFILLELPRIISLLVLAGLPERGELYIDKFRDVKCEEAGFIYSEAQAELFLGKNDYRQAVDRIEFILANMDLEVYPKKKLELLIFAAIAYDACDKEEPALECLRKALNTKGAEWNMRAFADRGEPLHDLLIKLVNQAKEGHGEHLPVIAEKLLKQFGDKNKELQTGSGNEAYGSLSARELEVLQLLAKGLSYDEIGNMLFVSLSTVKKHTGNIYSKLKAKNRTQAVNIAKAKGVIC